MNFYNNIIEVLISPEVTIALNSAKIRLIFDIAKSLSIIYGKIIPRLLLMDRNVDGPIGPKTKTRPAEPDGNCTIC